MSAQTVSERREIRVVSRLTQDQFENEYERAEMLANAKFMIRLRLDRIGVPVQAGTFITSITRDNETVVATTTWENHFD